MNRPRRKLRPLKTNPCGATGSLPVKGRTIAGEQTGAPAVPGEDETRPGRGSLLLKELAYSHISRCRIGAARATNASSPYWERASGLSAAGSLRPRRLGRKGEGSDPWALTQA